jgi:hypothetical protein
LNPYLSKIGFALVNWLFQPSPKVKIATLFVRRAAEPFIVSGFDALSVMLLWFWSERCIGSLEELVVGAEGR